MRVVREARDIDASDGLILEQRRAATAERKAVAGSPEADRACPIVTSLSHPAPTLRLTSSEES